MARIMMNTTLNLTLSAFIGYCLYLFALDAQQIQQLRADRGTESRIESSYEHELACQASYDLLSQSIIEQTEQCTTDAECESLARTYNIPENCI